MNEQDHYDLWLRHRRQVDVPDGFTDRVMSAVRQDVRVPSPCRWERVVATPIAQTGLALAAVFVFIVRFVLFFLATVG